MPEARSSASTSVIKPNDKPQQSEKSVKPKSPLPNKEISLLCKGLYICGSKPFKTRGMPNIPTCVTAVVHLSTLPKQALQNLKDRQPPPREFTVKIGKKKQDEIEADELRRALKFVEEERKKGGAVVVHCSQGKHRSGGFCALVIARDSGEKPRSVGEALEEVRKKRRGVGEGKYQKYYEVLDEILKNPESGV